MKQAKVLTNSELKRALSIVSTGRHAGRNRMAVLLSHYAGLRVGEISGLKWQQLLETDGSIKAVFYLNPANTKSKKARAVHLNAMLVREFVKFSAAQEVQRLYGPVIASQKGAEFSPNSMCQLFCRIYKEAGISGASSHSGRRWFITNLAHSGVSPKVIMELAGHQNLRTTQRYIEVNQEMKQKAVELLY